MKIFIIAYLFLSEVALDFIVDFFFYRTTDFNGRFIDCPVVFFNLI